MIEPLADSPHDVSAFRTVGVVHAQGNDAIACSSCGEQMAEHLRVCPPIALDRACAWAAAD